MQKRETVSSSTSAKDMAHNAKVQAARIEPCERALACNLLLGRDLPPDTNHPAAVWFRIVWQS
jgi:hypothetical protein